mmetsp:Transcript_91930/g.264495  ORF Transcript_91930/g.264495 Transcript_91930/m.264495 type:complete len:308 (+) Transcript_91930:1216-2139(+)
MADLLVRPAMDQVHEGEEDAQARVDVIGEPLLLDLAVSLEVLRRRAAGVQGHHGTDGLRGVGVVDGLLLLVPGGHIVAVAGAPGRVAVDLAVLVVAALLALPGLVVAREGHAEDLLQRLLLEGGQELPRFVEHALGRDRQTHEPRQHVRRRGVRAHRGMHRKPKREAQEHVATGDVHKHEPHEPSGGRRGVETDTPGAVDGSKDRQAHRGDAVIAVLARDRELRELRDIRLVHLGLGDGHVQTRGEPGVMVLLVEHVVPAVVGEEAHADAARCGGRRGRRHLHGRKVSMPVRGAQGIGPAGGGRARR